MEPQWLKWARQLQALAQDGLTYTENPFDRERFGEIRQIAAEILSTHTDVSVEKWLDVFLEDQGYCTPKVDVRGVVFRQDAILLVQEKADHNRWTLPGGWADPGFSPAENVVKEIREESGLETRVKKLLAVYDRSKHPHTPFFLHHIYKMFFLCEQIGGEPKSSIETGQIAFFRETELPELSLSRITPRQLARIFEHRRNPHWPADFD